MRLIYLTGVPGSGKSSLLAALTAGLVDSEARHGQMPVVEYRDTSGALAAVEPGRRRGAFSGTDALSMSIMPTACRWIAEQPFRLVLAEGDRLASPKFWGAAEAAGYEVLVVLVDVPEELAAARRVARGSSQNETWLAGRATKVRNQRDRVDLVLDGRGDPADMALDLRWACDWLPGAPETA